MNGISLGSEHLCWISYFCFLEVIFYTYAQTWNNIMTLLMSLFWYIHHKIFLRYSTLWYSFYQSYLIKMHFYGIFESDILPKLSLWYPSYKTSLISFLWDLSNLSFLRYLSDIKTPNNKTAMQQNYANATKLCQCNKTPNAKKTHNYKTPNVTKHPMQQIAQN